MQHGSRKETQIELKGSTWLDVREAGELFTFEINVRMIIERFYDTFIMNTSAAGGSAKLGQTWSDIDRLGAEGEIPIEPSDMPLTVTITKAERGRL